MTDAETEPTIIGWTPTWHALVAAGALIALALAALCLVINNPLGGLFTTALGLWSAVAALVLITVLREMRAYMVRKLASDSWVTPVIMMLVGTKMVCVIAFVLLGLAALAAYLIGESHWQNLRDAVLLSLMLNIAVTLVQEIVASLTALRARRTAAL